MCQTKYQSFISIIKKTLLAILILATFHFASAQITVDANDGLKIGQTYYRAYESPTHRPILSEGSNMVWDYSKLALPVKDTIHVISPSQTGFATKFPTSNVAISINLPEVNAQLYGLHINFRVIFY